MTDQTYRTKMSFAMALGLTLCLVPAVRGENLFSRPDAGAFDGSIEAGAPIQLGVSERKLATGHGTAVPYAGSRMGFVRSMQTACETVVSNYVDFADTGGTNGQPLATNSTLTTLEAWRARAHLTNGYYRLTSNGVATHGLAEENDQENPTLYAELTQGLKAERWLEGTANSTLTPTGISTVTVWHATAQCIWWMADPPSYYLGVSSYSVNPLESNSWDAVPDARWADVESQLLSMWGTNGNSTIVISNAGYIAGALYPITNMAQDIFFTNQSTVYMSFTSTNTTTLSGGAPAASKTASWSWSPGVYIDWDSRDYYFAYPYLLTTLELTAQSVNGHVDYAGYPPFDLFGTQEILKAVDTGSHDYTDMTISFQTPQTNQTAVNMVPPSTNVFVNSQDAWVNISVGNTSEPQIPGYTAGEEGFDPAAATWSETLQTSFKSGSYPWYCLRSAVFTDWTGQTRTNFQYCTNPY